MAVNRMICFTAAGEMGYWKMLKRAEIIKYLMLNMR
jgi:hypothetical protein